MHGPRQADAPGTTAASSPNAQIPRAAGRPGRETLTFDYGVHIDNPMDGPLAAVTIGRIQAEISKTVRAVAAKATAANPSRPTCTNSAPPRVGIYRGKPSKARRESGRGSASALSHPLAERAQTNAVNAILDQRPALHPGPWHA